MANTTYDHDAVTTNLFIDSLMESTRNPELELKNGNDLYLGFICKKETAEMFQKLLSI